jgi:hypothetical protein
LHEAFTPLMFHYPGRSARAEGSAGPRQKGPSTMSKRAEPQHQCYTFSCQQALADSIEELSDRLSHPVRLGRTADNDEIRLLDQVRGRLFSRDELGSSMFAKLTGDGLCEFAGVAMTRPVNHHTVHLDLLLLLRV